MNRIHVATAGIALLLSSFSFAAQDVASAVEGTVKKVDTTTKTIVVTTADGADHTFQYSKDLAIHGAGDVRKGSAEALHGMKDGSTVAVHYTTTGGKDVAHEIDNVGSDGLKVAKGTVSKVNSAADTISVKTEDGTEQTFHMTTRATKDTSKAIVSGADKTAKITLYYTEDAGTKTAHFIKAAF